MVESTATSPETMSASTNGLYSTMRQYQRRVKPGIGKAMKEAVENDTATTDTIGAAMKPRNKST